MPLLLKTNSIFFVSFRPVLLVRLYKQRGEWWELQRRAKILLQVAPDWQKRTAPVNARLTPEEEQKVMALINQSKVS